MSEIHLDGVKLNYSVEGSGPVVMAISGLMSTVATSQFRLVPGLPQAYTLIYGDHRGAGGSDAPPGPYTIDRIADDWIAIMDAEGIERAPLMGNSMGSLIAQSMALRYPERVSGLVLSVPVTHADDRLSALTGHWLRTLETQGVAEFTLQTLLWTLTPSSFNRLAVPLLAQVDQTVLPEISRDGFRGQVAALTRYDARERLGEIAVPTLVIAGAEDIVCPPSHAQELARLIPGAELVLLEGAAHLAQTEQPQAYAAAVLPFLAAHHEER